MVTQREQPRSWLTVGKIGDYCQVNRATVRRWIKSGKLPAIRLPGGHYRVSTADFRNFLKRYEIPIREDFFKSESKRN